MNALVVYKAVPIGREAGKSAVTGAILRGIESGLRTYHERFADYPPSLFVLVDAGMLTRKQLVTPFDPSGFEQPPHRPQTDTSFVYHPGAGPWIDDDRIILAYERAPFCSAEADLAPSPGRFVVFGTGQVRWLPEGVFAAALEEDRLRRREIGWPKGGE